MLDIHVVVIGAGLAGLSCARHLFDLGYAVTVVEKDNQIGGRVKSKTVDGFIIDDGFQVILDAYPALTFFNLKADLDLKPFAPGAKIVANRCINTLSDPFRYPTEALPSIITPVVTLKDKLLLWTLTAELSRRPVNSLWGEPDQTTLRFLRRKGFSTAAIDCFFRPFFGGISLDENLNTSACFFQFVWAMLSRGSATLPSGGMQALPAAIAHPLLQNGHVLLEHKVQHVSVSGAGWAIRSDKSPEIHADIVVLALDPWNLQQLCSSIPPPIFKSQRTVWVAVDSHIPSGPCLILNPARTKAIATIAGIHEVDPTRCPPDTSLFACTIRLEYHNKASHTDILDELKQILNLGRFCSASNRFWILDDQFYEKAQFDQPAHSYQSQSDTVFKYAGMYLCGDYMKSCSIDGAIESGVAVAAAIHQSSLVH